MAYQNKAYNFVLRLVVACVFAPLVILITATGGLAFTSMIVVAAIIMGAEWSQMTYKKNNLWKLAGIPYILIPCVSLIWIAGLPSGFAPTEHATGTNLIITIFVLVWANDIGGYVFGKLIGGKKLCPKISPNKTISGFIGGVVCSLALAPVLGAELSFAVIVAIIASIGDLIESWMKRRCKVKDSGNIIPGHGGLLDRVDGVLVVISLFALIVFFSN